MKNQVDGENQAKVDFDPNNQTVKGFHAMNNAPFISVSDLARNPREAIDSLALVKGHKTILRNNQLAGYLLAPAHHLAKLLDISPTLEEVDFFELAFRKGLEESWLQQFMDTYGVEPTKGAHSIDRLIGVENPELMRQLPGKDHYTLWERNGVPALFTMQVYTMHMDTFNALSGFCVKHGLVYNIEGRGWYYPGVSTLIVIEKNKEGADRS